jgi:hypothetical protein
MRSDARIRIAQWTRAASPEGVESYRCDLYRDENAGPGNVRAMAATITHAENRWQMHLHATVIAGDGTVHAGTIGKHYKDLETQASAKKLATRCSNAFRRGETMAFQPDARARAWRPGDRVLDAAGAVWVRASATDAADGRPWGKPPATAWRMRGGRLTVSIPAGRHGDDRVTEPMVLLIRDGNPAR